MARRRGRPGHAEFRPREAVDAVDLRRRPCDAPYLRNRLRVCHEVDVPPWACPVIERGEIRYRSTDRNVEPPIPSQSPEHLGDVGIRGNDHVWLPRGDQGEQFPCAPSRQEGLSGSPRETGFGEKQETTSQEKQ